MNEPTATNKKISTCNQINKLCTIKSKICRNKLFFALIRFILPSGTLLSLKIATKSSKEEPISRSDYEFLLIRDNRRGNLDVISIHF